MDAEGIGKRVGLFALILVVVVGAVAANAAMEPAPSRQSAEIGDVSASTFDPGAITASTPETTGSISMSADASDAVVLVDMGHDNDVSEEQIGPAIRALSRNGAEVRFLTRDQARGPGFNESLRQADAFVSISPQQSFTGEQLAGLSAFADGGGRVLLLGEPMSMGLTGIFFVPTESGSPAPMASVTSEFGMAVGNGYLYNMAENANNYRSVYATPGAGSGLTEGVDRVVLREGTTLSGGQPILTATEGTTLSTNREAATYPVAATSGNVTAVGDATFFTETGYQQADNEVLTGNLLDFLVSGDKVAGVPGDNGDAQKGEQTGGERPPEPP